MIRFKIFAFILLCGLQSFAAVKSSFDVSRYGAVGDGKTLNTAAIQKVIETCSNSGGGIVHFPAGKWLSGTILLKSGVVYNSMSKLFCWAAQTLTITSW